MLVGRTAERTRLEALVDGLRKGRSSALALVGEPGVGKTALLDDVRTRVDEGNILRTQGFEAERDLPYAGLSMLLRPIGDVIEEIPASQSRALNAALGRGPPVAADRFTVYAGVLGVLASAAEERPRLVVVDDAHWLDAASLEALLFGARRLEDEGIGMLFAGREGEGADLEAVGLPVLRVGGLDRQGVAAMIEARAGVRPADDVVRRIHSATGGNPLAVGELAGLLRGAQVEGSEPLDDPLPAGADVRRAFGQRLQALPAETRRALLFAAAEPAATVDTLDRAYERRGFVSALVPAESAGLVSLSAAGVAFRHPLVRAVAYELATGSQRRAAHAALAKVLHGEAFQERRAWHAARAATGPDEAVARELAMTARSVHGRVAPEAAARMLDAAAGLTPSRELRIERRLEAAQTYGMAARLEPARRLLAEVLGEAPDDACLRADVQQLRARVETMNGGQTRYRKMLVEEADRVVLQDGNRAASLLADAAYLSVMDGELRLALDYATRAGSLGARLDGRAELEVEQSLGGALVLSGRIDEGLVHLQRAERLLEREDTLVDFKATGLAMSYYWAERYEHARGLLGAVIVRGRREGVVAALPSALAVMAWIDFRLGDWTLAQAEVMESLSLAAATGQWSERGFSLMRLAELEAARGTADECRAHVQEALRVADELGVGSLYLMAGPVLGLLEIACGPTPDTIERLEATGRHCLERGLEEPMVLPWTQELTEAYLRLGDLAGAERTLSRLEHLARRSGQHSAAAVACRYRGMLAADDTEAGLLFRRALEHHEQMPTPFDRARTELCFGERLRRARKRSDARDQLRSALATFDRLRAAPWADRTRRELAATGERARRRVPDTRDHLTPQELQVALLVAEGATNREAAAQLFVSAKTIETHLSHTYRKLGVRSRTELARAVTVQPPASRSDAARSRA
jgi:DNA-binding CsgD family transcriptional regulator